MTPNGGEILTIGSPYTITWQTKGPSLSSDAYVNMFLEKEGVVEFGRLNEFGVPASQGSFTWGVSQYFVDTQEGARTYHQVETGDKYRIRLIYIFNTESQPVESVEDFSDDYFSIITD